MILTSDDTLLADLYLLGLLDPSEFTAIELRMRRDRAFAALVAAAARRFAPLDESVDPIPLPSGAWERLEKHLSEPVTKSVQSTPPGNTRISAVNLNRAPWRLVWGLAAALLLALGLSSLVLDKAPTGRPSDAIAVAVLLDPDGEPFALIEDFGGGKAAVTALAQYEVPDGRSLQAWTKWSEEAGPVSLGVLEVFTSAALGAEGIPQPIFGQLYEITLEQKGGSATGRPTGPILGVGRASIPG